MYLPKLLKLFVCTLLLLQTFIEKVGPSKNLLVSPFSLASVLAMTHVGANGNTAKQLKKTMQLANYTDEQIYKAFANLVQSIQVYVGCIYYTKFKF